MTPPLSDRIARAICRETCAAYGDPPCFELEDHKGRKVEWPYACERDCQALAAAVVAELGLEEK
jgi:hypothetical protein